MTWTSLRFVVWLFCCLVVLLFSCLVDSIAYTFNKITKQRNNKKLLRTLISKDSPLYPMNENDYRHIYRVEMRV